MLIPLNLSKEDEQALLRRGSANEVEKQNSRGIMIEILEDVIEILREVKEINKNLKRMIKEDNL